MRTLRASSAFLPLRLEAKPWVMFEYLKQYKRIKMYVFFFFFLLRVRGFVQERQSIIKYWLDNLRAKQGEVLHNIHFLEGQPISMLGGVL